MSHRSLFWPIALIIVAAATIVMVIMGTSLGLEIPRAAAADCPTTYPDYAGCLKTQTAEAPAIQGDIIQGCPTEGPAFDPPYPPYPQCQQTRTALLLQTQNAGGQATPTATTGGGGGGGGGAAATLTPTSTFASTPTATATLAATATAQQAATSGAPGASATPTATLPASVEDQLVGADAILCVPGQTIAIEGSAGPTQALIVTFGDRPVGGGFSRADGAYLLRLLIGDERPGTYPVQVQERLTRDVVRQLTCQVPAFTPTPTPPLVP